MRAFNLLLTALALTPEFVRAQPTTITNQPTDQVAWTGESVEFSVGISGTGPFSYQWQLNSNNLPNGIITTVAGIGTNTYSGDGGTATNAGLNNPYGVALDAAGNLFIADRFNERIRKVNTSGDITTVAGIGTNTYSGDGGAATNAGLNNPYGVAVDAAGNLFIADRFNNRIRKVSTNGVITTVAGNGRQNYAGDGGAATNASLSFPCGVTVDASGNLLIADTLNLRIRKVSTNGIITTIAGNGTIVYSGDGGAATNSGLYYPFAVAVDLSGNVFIADEFDYSIRKVDTNGVITTAAGNGSSGYSGDGGAATNASLNLPLAVAVDISGNLFIADYGNNCIRMVDINGIITTVAGNGSSGYSGDGNAATNASLNSPRGVAVDPSGNLLIADTVNNRIRKVTSIPGSKLLLNSVTSSDAGSYQVVITGSSGSVTSSVASLIVGAIISQPASRANVKGTTATFSVAVEGITRLSFQWLKNGSILTDGGNVSGSIANTLKLSNVQEADAASYTVVMSNNMAGSVTSSPAALLVIYMPTVTNEPAIQAVWAGVNVAFSVGVSGTGPFTYQWQLNSTNLPDGIITTVAGNGASAYSGDGGPATHASLTNPLGVAVDAADNLFIADFNSECIRMVNTSGIITTVAGNGMYGYSGDGGAATNASLAGPWGVAVDASGNLFIANADTNRVRKVNANGVITTVAGNGMLGYSGDGGEATNASIIYPEGVAVDASENLFIEDGGNIRIRKVDTNGIITTIAGNGTNGYSGDGGVATNASLCAPSYVAVDAAGNLFIADTGNNRIREVNVNGIITTIAGGGARGLGDGSAATNAILFYPSGVTVDAFGNLFFADTYNQRIRMVNTNGIITTVAGNGTRGYSGDNGVATNASLDLPYDVKADAAGNLFIADLGNSRIRKITPHQGREPTLTLNDVSTANAGNYRVALTGSSGNFTNSVVNLIVATSPLIYQTTLNSDGSVALNFVSRPASTNVVLCATNLLPPVVWQPISTNVAGANGDWQFTDTNTAGCPARFYRSLMQ